MIMYFGWGIRDPSAILARQCRSQHVLLIRPSGSLEQQEFSLNDVTCMNTEKSSWCTLSLYIQCVGIWSAYVRDAVILQFFCIPKVDYGRKRTRFWKLPCLTKIGPQSRHPPPPPPSSCHVDWKVTMIYHLRLKNNSITSTMFFKPTIKVVANCLGHPV